MNLKQAIKLMAKVGKAIGRVQDAIDLKRFIRLVHSDKGGGVWSARTRGGYFDYSVCLPQRNVCSTQRGYRRGVSVRGGAQ